MRGSMLTGFGADTEKLDKCMPRSLNPPGPKDVETGSRVYDFR